MKGYCASHLLLWSALARSLVKQLYSFSHVPDPHLHGLETVSHAAALVLTCIRTG